MKLSLRFLSDYVKSEFYREPKSYCDRMTATGSKVEGYELAGEDVLNVVIAKITEVKPHPDADRLQICAVDTGKETIQVVTAAQNVFAGALVPVALDGASLPGGVKIQTGKLRGEVSQGMFCSIAELGLTIHDMPGAAEDGILILPSDAPIGEDIRDYLLLKDVIVEFEITPNRPDCLSVIGLARETAASFGVQASIPTPKVRGGAGKTGDLLQVSVKAPDLCERYLARAVKHVKIEPSPLWLRSKLRMMGVRPINNLVDITNLVMLEYGQPMHAFDYRTLRGKQIVVRRAKPGETMTTLDGNEHTLNPEMLMICDAVGPVGVAGVMGGLDSEIRDDTDTVIFESAIFSGASIRHTSRALGLRTESSARFEKGLDPETSLLAINRACELVELLGAGEVCDDWIDFYPAPRKQTVLPVEVERTNRFLGIEIDRARFEEILTSLNFEIRGDEVWVPHYRQDVQDFADLAEEIARIYGYDHVRASAFSGAAQVGGRSEFAEFLRKVHRECVALGFFEIQTYSFISPKFYDAILLDSADPRKNSVRIRNPLGEDTSIMRTTAIPSMLDALGHNFSYRNPRACLYETARLYHPIPGRELPLEDRAVTLGAYGDTDFYAFKGLCEALLNRLLGCGTPREKTYTIRRASSPYLHPGRSAEVWIGEERIGEFGEVHPDAARNFGLNTKAYLASFSAEQLFAHQKGAPHFVALPRFPAMTRDLSLICDAALSVGEVEDVIAASAGKKLESLKLFDIYTGSQIPEGKRGLSFTLTLRDAEKTLTDEEADRITAKALKALNERFGVTLRS